MKLKCLFLHITFFVTVMLHGATQEASLWLPSMFSDRMVLQQGKPVPIWGKADPGAEVTVEFADQRLLTHADVDGRWQVVLKPLAASNEGRELKISTGKETQVIRDAVVGEVWLLSGQSNMAFLMSSILQTPEILGSERRAEAAKAGKGPSQIKAERDMATANDPLLRTLRINPVSAERPREDVVTQEGWMTWDTEHASQFAAMAYYFGEKLRQELDVPVGIILCAWGGSSACSWISADRIRSPGLQSLFPEDVPDWGVNLSPSRLYNGMLKPVAPYAISGFCWYQGETEATELQNPFIYRHLLSHLIQDWRKAWHDNDLPFYLVQLPPWNGGDRWEVVRESQTKVLQQPKTAMVPTLDIVPPGDLHPKNKYAVAQRLAELALGEHYGRDTWPGVTLFEKAEVEEGGMRIHFQSGTMGLKTSDGKAPQEFQVAGDDKVFKTAEATIDGDTIVVRSAEVPLPVAVRYAWSPAPKVNLFNEGGIPVAPFRSDDWQVAGQEMVPQNLPVKESLSMTITGNGLLNGDDEPWVPSKDLLAETTSSKGAKDISASNGKGMLSVGKSGVRIQVKGFPQKKGWPVSPKLYWTANPDVDPDRGLTMEVGMHLFETGSREGGFDIEAAVPLMDGTFRRYRLTAFPSRLYTYQNFLGGRVPENTQQRLLRSDQDDVSHIYRIAIRPDGVAQIYDGSSVIGTTTGEIMAAGERNPYLRFGKMTEGGKWSATIYHAAFDTSGAFAPGSNNQAPSEDLTEHTE